MEQLKQLKLLKFSKAENKKVLIQEVDAANTKTQIVNNYENNSETGTRLIIEEVTNNMSNLKLDDLNSSDEDDVPELPQKVKQMLKVTANQKQKITPNILKDNEIEKSSQSKTNKIDIRPKLIEECQENLASKKTNSRNQHLNKFSNEFVSIKIEECQKEDKSLQNKIENHNSESRISNNLVLSKYCEAEIQVSRGDVPEIRNKASETRKSQEAVPCVKKLKSGVCCKFSADENLTPNNFEEKKQDKFFVNPDPNITITPYEFLCTWVTKGETENDIGAEYLLKIKPEELPKIISEKLDGPLLHKLLIAIYEIFKIGKCTEGKNYLYYLSKVPRIKIASLFLSEKEIESIQHLFSNMKDDTSAYMPYVNTILQI